MLTEIGERTEQPAVPAQSGLRRVIGMSVSLVGTQALTSVLGLAFWTLAARNFTTSDVGVAGAAVSMMLLLATLGSLGLGTLLIARLPLTDQGSRRVLVRTSLLAAGGTSGVLGAVVPLVAVHLFGADNLRPLVAGPLTVLGFATGTALMGVVLVLDQAVLTIGVGALQFERNVVASVVKVGVLALLGAMGVTGGMAIFLAWAVGTLVSLPLVSWRTRGGRALQQDRRVADPRALKGLARMAASHHALNMTLQAALQILPIMVTVLLSARDNAYFNSAILVTGFVFALPYAVAISLFASASGSENEVLSRIQLTLPFSLAVSVLANIALYPLAGFVLGVFGQTYASEGVNILHALVLAGLPFVVKDHFIALRRVQGRTTEAVWLLGGFLVVELAAAAIGAKLGGTVGLCLAWVGVLMIEAVIMAFPLYSSWRRYRRATVIDPASPKQAIRIDDLPTPPIAAPPGSAADSPLITATADRPGAIQPTDAGRNATVVDRTPGPGRLHRRSLRNVNLAGPTVLLMSLGVLVMALAAAAGRDGSTSAVTSAAWIAGLVLIFLPACLRVVLPGTGHVERMVLAVALPMMLQFSRLVLNPTRFAFHDEFIHANTLRQIDETAHLFSQNSLLPVSGYYPGLEVVTDSIQAVTGLGMFASSVITLMLARAVISLVIIALVTLVTGSRRAGAIGAVIYVANPQELFFNSQYSYQTLALPLAILAVYLFAIRRRGTRTALVLPVVTTAMVTFTHHLTAMLVVAAFAVWLIVDLVADRRDRRRAATVPGGPGPVGQIAPSSTPSDPPTGRTPRHRPAGRDRGGLLWMTIVSAALSLLAALNPGSPVRSYLESIVGSSTEGVTSLTEGSDSKALFADTAGSGPLWWEQILLVAAVAIAMLAMFVVLKYLWQRRRTGSALAIIVGFLALLYPVIPAGHLTSATAEVGDRASGFVFVGLAAVLGWWIWASRWRLRSLLAFTAAALVLFLGNIVLGAGPTAGQLPGPYEISADARSVDAANTAAAAWLVTGVPADSVVYGDRTSGLLAAALGGQSTVLHVSTGIDASRLLLDPNFTAKDIAVIKQAHLAYLIVDTRLSTGLPHQQFYIESGEFGGTERTGPVSATALTKFAGVPGVQRVYDNGALVIYDVRGLNR